MTAATTEQVHLYAPQWCSSWCQRRDSQKVVNTGVDAPYFQRSSQTHPLDKQRKNDFHSQGKASGWSAVCAMNENTNRKDKQSVTFLTFEGVTVFDTESLPRWYSDITMIGRVPRGRVIARRFHPRLLPLAAHSSFPSPLPSFLNNRDQLSCHTKWRAFFSGPIKKLSRTRNGDGSEGTA